eukprot:7065758-Lingulodinium_polyedra.AAC.1
MRKRRESSKGQGALASTPDDGVRAVLSVATLGQDDRAGLEAAQGHGPGVGRLDAAVAREL